MVSAAGLEKLPCFLGRSKHVAVKHYNQFYTSGDQVFCSKIKRLHGSRPLLAHRHTDFPFYAIILCHRTNSKYQTGPFFLHKVLMKAKRT